MKRMLFASLLLFVMDNVWAQDYTPLLDDVNEWQVTNCYFGCNTDAYYTDGDTIVNGKTHKILDGYHYISRTLLLREDIDEKKVYFTRVVSPNNILEYLIYDFSKEEGDTIQMLNPITPFPENGGYFLLDSIVAQPLVDGEDYRHFYFTPTQSNTISTNNAVWVEGLGSLSIVNAPGGDPDINGVGQVSCFFKNGDLFYSNLDSISGCEPVLRVNDLKKPLSNIIPVYDYSNEIVTLHNTSEVVLLTLHDITGKFLKHTAHEGAGNITISTGALNAGIYIISLLDKTKAKRVLKLSVK